MKMPQPVDFQKVLLIDPHALCTWILLELWAAVCTARFRNIRAIRLATSFPLALESLVFSLLCVEVKRKVARQDNQTSRRGHAKTRT